MPDLKLARAVLWTVAVLALLGVMAAIMADEADAVESITLSISGSDTQSATPGNTAVFKINITNVLTTTSLTVNLTKSSAPTGWSAQLSQTSLSLTPQQTKAVTLTVGVPSGAAADSVGQQITVTATPDYGDTEQMTTTTKVSQVYGIQTYTSVLLKHTVGGTGVTFTMKVNNTGNGQDTVAITHSGEPSGWAVTHVSSLSVPANASRDVTVSVVPPSNAVAGTYLPTVKATASDNVKSDQITFTIIIDPRYGLTLSSADVSKYITPKVAAYYNMNLTNTGNADDTVTISIEGIPSLWTVLPTSNPVSLAPGETKAFQILVTAPSTALAGAQYQIKVKASSYGNTSIVRDLTINAVVNQVYDPRVTPIVNTKVVSPGSSVTFKINVTNNGNGNDTVDLGVSGVPTGQGWVYNFNPTSVTLTPGQTKSVDLSFSLGSQAAFGDIQVTVRGTSHGTTTSGTSTIIVSVTQFYSIALVPDGAATKRVDPGAAVTFNFSVTNTGNGPDDITFSVVGLPVGWVSYFSRTTVYNVGANATQTTILTLEVPSTAHASTYRFDLRAVSEGNSSVFRTIRNVTAIVNQLYNVDLYTETTYLKGESTTGVTMDIVVTNTGSGTDNVTMTVPSTYVTWVTFNVTTVKLGAGASSTVKATIAPPATQPMGTVSISIRGASKGRPTVYDEVAFTFEVLQTFKPELTAVEPTIHKRPGETATFGMVLKNGGNGPDTYKVNFTSNPRSLASHTLASPFVPLNQGATRSFSVSVTLPSDEPVGDLVFVLLATSQNKTTAVHSISLTVVVDPVYGLVFYSYGLNTTAQPTDAAAVELRIENLGNTVDTFALKAIGPYYKWVSFKDNPVSVPRADETIFDATITVPDDDTVTLGTYFINVTATSTHDATKTKTLELKVEVKHKEDVDVTITDSIRSRSTDPGGSVVYKLTVRNEGLKQHVVNIAATGTHVEWVTLSKKTALLAANATTEVNVTIAVPKGQAPETFDTTVTASLDDMATRTDGVVLSTTINRISGVVVQLNLTAVAGLPGEAVKVTFNVNNTGNARDTFTVAVDAWGSWVTLSPAQVTIEAGANQNVTVTVKAPLDPLTRKGYYYMNVSATSKGSPATASKAQLRHEVEQVFSVLAKIAPASRSVDPGTTAVYDVTITNKGNGLDNFTFIIGGARKAWGRMSKTQVGIEAGKDGTVTLSVRVPANQPVETAVIWVLVSSTGNGTANVTLSTTTTVLPFYGVELTVSQDLLPAFPGRPTVFALKVKNAGNSDDTFSFDVSGAQSSWMATLSPQTVDPGNVVSVDVVVTPPSDARNGQYTFTINASSDTQGDAYDIITLKVNINVYHGLLLRLDKPGIETRPNVTERVTLSVDNKGNVNDTFDLRALGTYASWVTLSNASVTAVPGATGVSTATIRVPANLTTGIYTLRFEAKSRAGGNVTEIELPISIQLIYGAVLVPMRAATPAAPNTTIELGASLRNTGNSIDTFDLEVRQLPSDSWTVTLPFTQSRLAPGAMVHFNITVDLPAGLRAGTYQVLLRATSRGATAPAPFASVALNVTIGYAVSAAGPDEVTTIAPGSFRTVKVLVKNDGLGLDTFTLKAEDPNAAWLAIEPSTVVLGPGDSVTVDVTVTPAQGALTGSYTLKVRATSVSDRTVSALADVRVRVSQVFAVEVTPDTVELSGAQGGTVTSILTLHNKGNGDDTVSLGVRGVAGARFDATLNSTTLALKARQNVTVKLTIRVESTALAGEYELFIDALSGGTTGASDSSSVLFTIPTVHKVDALTASGSPSATVNVGSGQSQQLTVEVFNRGNAADTFSVWINSTTVATWVGIDEPQLSLDPGESALVQVTVTVPQLAVAGTYRFDVAAMSTRGLASDAVAVTLVVPAFHSVYLTSDTSTVTVNPRAGQDATFDITVHNDGNTKEVVTLDVTAPSGWGQPEVDPEAVTIEAFETAIMTLTFKAAVIPTTALETNGIEVVAQYAEESPVLNLMITVLKAKIAISGGDITFDKPNPKVGDTVQVKVTVRNTGVVDSVPLSVVLLVGSVESASTSGLVVKAGGSESVTLNWEVSEDVAGGAPIIEVRVREADLTVRATSPPTVQEAEGGIMATLKDLGFTTTLMIGLVLGIVLGLVLVVAVRRRYLRRVEAARAAGMAEGMSMAGETKRAKPAPPGSEKDEGEGEAGDEGLGEEGEEGEEEDGGEAAGEGEAPKEEAAPGVPPVTVQCPRCSTINKVTTVQRPHEFRCKQCSALLRLSK